MSSAPPPLRRLLALATFVTTAVAACTDLQGPAPAPSTVAAPFLAAFTDYPSVTDVVVTVTGPRIDPALVFNFPVVNDTARGTITLPVGSDRVVLAQAFDGGGAEVLRGQRTVTVVAGANPALALVLQPLTGTLPVTAVVGSVTLSISAGSSTVRAGSTVAVTAEVRDETNAVIATPVRYAVSRPPAARITADGLLLALDTGTVTVTATALGRAASTTLTLTPGTVLDGVVPQLDSVIGSGNVEAVVSLRDDVGVDSVRLRSVSPTGATGPTCVATAPLRGTRTLGEFSCLLVFPGGAESGRWPISAVELHAGANVAVLDSVALRHRGAAAAVRIVP